MGHVLALLKSGGAVVGAGAASPHPSLLPLTFASTTTRMTTNTDSRQLHFIVDLRNVLFSSSLSGDSGSPTTSSVTAATLSSHSRFDRQPRPHRHLTRTSRTS